MDEILNCSGYMTISGHFTYNEAANKCQEFTPQLHVFWCSENESMPGRPCSARFCLGYRELVLNKTGTWESLKLLVMS